MLRGVFGQIADSMINEGTQQNNATDGAVVLFVIYFRVKAKETKRQQWILVSLLFYSRSWKQAPELACLVRQYSFFISQ